MFTRQAPNVITGAVAYTHCCHTAQLKALRSAPNVASAGMGRPAVLKTTQQTTRTTRGGGPCRQGGDGQEGCMAVLPGHLNGLQ